LGIEILDFVFSGTETLGLEFGGFLRETNNSSFAGLADESGLALTASIRSGNSVGVETGSAGGGGRTSSAVRVARAELNLEISDSP
jgi:hypothetical protein